MSVVVIVAAVDDRADVRTCLARFADEVRGRGRVLLMDATKGGISHDVAGVESVRRPPGSLAPELWRDGIGATDEADFALTTSQMTPVVGWLDAMLGNAGAAAVGGPIVPGAGLGAFDRAVYLLRYVNYLTPRQAVNHEPAGDNAVYRRAALNGLGDLVSGGFWEAEIHRVIRDRGGLAIGPEAVVVFNGGSRPMATLRRRFLHARHYGAGRATRFGLGAKLARTAVAPLVPVLMAARVVLALRTRRQRLMSWISAVPWLLPLLAVWAAGEVVGLWRGAAPSRKARDEFSGWYPNRGPRVPRVVVNPCETAGALARVEDNPWHPAPTFRGREAGGRTVRHN